MNAATITQKGKRKGEGYSPYNNNDSSSKKSKYCYVHKSNKHDISECRKFAQFQKSRKHRNRKGHGNKDNPGLKDSGGFGSSDSTVQFNYFCNSKGQIYTSFFVNLSLNAIALQSTFASSNPYEWGIDSYANCCITSFKDRFSSYC